MVVAKRLTKALRGKRRWIGVFVSADLTTRSAVEASLDQLAATAERDPPKLMDFFSAEECSTFERTELLDPFNPAGHGLAILQIPLPNVPSYRNLLQTTDALVKHGLQSLTSSGKIRLVRLRLGLPKPVRKRK